MVVHGSINPAWKSTENKEDVERAEFYIKRPAEELYDVKKDPYQLENLAGRPALNGVVKELKLELAAFMEQQGDEGVVTEMRVFERQKRKRKKKNK